MSNKKQHPYQGVILGIAITGILLLPSASTAQQIGVGAWWEFIHCHGISTNHSIGSPVDPPEEFEDGNDSYQQCHGTKGEEGTCNLDGLSEGVFGKVTCTNVNIGNGTTSRCIAQATCTDGTTLYCLSMNGQAFAGIETRSNGEKKLYLVCRSGGGTLLGSGICSVD